MLDETALFLHRVVADLPVQKQQMLERLHQSDEDLRSKKVLVVDDDVRNIFALGSVLERHGMTFQINALLEAKKQLVAWRSRRCSGSC